MHAMKFKAIIADIENGRGGDDDYHIEVTTVAGRHHGAHRLMQTTVGSVLVLTQSADTNGRATTEPKRTYIDLDGVFSVELHDD